MESDLIRKIKSELKKSVVMHYKALKEHFPHDSIYGYSLYTTDLIEGVGPVANRESAFKVDPSDSMYIYYRYSPDEWCDWDDFGMFDEVNQLIKQAAEDADDVFSEYINEEFLDGMKIIMLETLTELENEGLFGIKDDKKFLVIWMSDSSNEIMDTSAKALNSPKVYREFASEFKI